MFEILILSIIQGVTEFLPISSSAHLIIISDYFNFKANSLMIDISLHTGSLLAIVVYYKNDLFISSKNKKIIINIFFSSLPVIFIGYILIKFNLIENLRNYKIISFTTIIFAIFLYISDKYPAIKNKKMNFTLKSFFIIGLFQTLSLVPGVSRSGITISAARLLNFSREDSAKISFLLSVPILSAVTIYNVLNIYKLNNFNLSEINFIAFFFSFLTSFLTIKYFLAFLKKNNFNFFIIYRIILGLFLLLLIK